MGMGMNYSLALAVLLVAGMFISDEQVSAASCDASNLVAKCQSYVMKPGPETNPSKDCCDVVKGVDVPCICSHVTKQIEDLISMKKVLHVAQFCGKQIPSGTKCGSYTVPSA